MKWWEIALWIVPSEMVDEIILLETKTEGRKIILDIEKKFDGRIKIRPSKARPTQRWEWDGIELKRVG